MVEMDSSGITAEAESVIVQLPDIQDQDQDEVVIKTKKILEEISTHSKACGTLVKELKKKCRRSQVPTSQVSNNNEQ